MPFDDRMHGHYKGQYVDGLRTPLIIHPDEPQDQPYKYDEDYTFVLGDWYHDEHAYLLSDFFLNRNNPTGAEPVPKSGLMYIASTPGNSSDAFYLPGFNENATLSFTPGKTYRLRIINMSALAMFQFYLDGHDMRVSRDHTASHPFRVSDHLPSFARSLRWMAWTQQSCQSTSSPFLSHSDTASSSLRATTRRPTGKCTHT